MTFQAPPYLREHLAKVTLTCEYCCGYGTGDAPDTPCDRCAGIGLHPDVLNVFGAYVASQIRATADGYKTLLRDRDVIINELCDALEATARTADYDDAETARELAKGHRRVFLPATKTEGSDNG